MRRLPSLLLVVFVFVAVASFAAGKRLSDRQMDAITAGAVDGGGSGIVALDGSSAYVKQDNAVVLDHTAGTDATALNFIVSSGSFVGTGTNIWYGRDSDDAPDWVRQSNYFSQTLGGGARVNEYREGTDVDLRNLLIVVRDLEFEDDELELDLVGIGIKGLTVDFGGEIPHASGEFIVADDSTLKYSSTNSVTLDNGALTGASALNIITAANSLVATGLNLAISSQDLTSLHSINQSNVIRQHF